MATGLKIANLDLAPRLLKQIVATLSKVHSCQPTKFFSISLYSLSCNHLVSPHYIFCINSDLTLNKFSMSELYLKCFALSDSSNFEVSWRLNEIYTVIIL